MLSRLHINHKTRGGLHKTIWEVEDEIKLLIGAKGDEKVEVEVVMRNMSILSKKIEEFKERTLPAVDQALAAWRRQEHTGYYGGCGFWARLTGAAPVVSTSLAHDKVGYADGLVCGCYNVRASWRGC